MAKRQKSRQTYEYKKLAKDSGSDDDGEEIDLFVKKKSPKREIPTVDKEVEEGDTLQSLAIRYHCTIEDLKRLNNIHKENEIFAKRIIKVPHRPFSVALAGVHISGNSSPETEPIISETVDLRLLNSKLNTAASNHPRNDGTREVNEIIFNSSIQRLEVVTSEPVRNDLMSRNEEEIGLLPQRQQSTEPIVSALNCNGADCDISWISLVILILIGIVAIPLIYVYYIAEHIEEYHKNVSCIPSSENDHKNVSCID